MFPLRAVYLCCGPQISCLKKSIVSVFLSCALLSVCRRAIIFTVHRNPSANGNILYHEPSTMTKAEHSTCVIDHGPHRVRHLPSTMAASYVSDRTRQIPVSPRPSSPRCPTALYPASSSSPAQTTQEVHVRIPQTSTTSVHRITSQGSLSERVPCSVSSPSAGIKIS